MSYNLVYMYLMTRHVIHMIVFLITSQQVQHILASTSPSGRFVVWDLRKNEPIITVADRSTMVNCSYVTMVTAIQLFHVYTWRAMYGASCHGEV